MAIIYGIIKVVTRVGVKKLNFLCEIVIGEVMMMLLQRNNGDFVRVGSKGEASRLLLDFVIERMRKAGKYLSSDVLKSDPRMFKESFFETYRGESMAETVERAWNMVRVRIDRENRKEKFKIRWYSDDIDGGRLSNWARGYGNIGGGEQQMSRKKKRKEQDPKKAKHWLELMVETCKELGKFPTKRQIKKDNVLKGSEILEVLGDGDWLKMEQAVRAAYREKYGESLADERPVDKRTKRTKSFTWKEAEEMDVQEVAVQAVEEVAEEKALETVTEEAVEEKVAEAVVEEAMEEATEVSMVKTRERKKRAPRYSREELIWQMIRATIVNGGTIPSVEKLKREGLTKASHGTIAKQLSENGKWNEVKEVIQKAMDDPTNQERIEEIRKEVPDEVVVSETYEKVVDMSVKQADRSEDKKTNVLRVFTDTPVRSMKGNSRIIEPEGRIAEMTINVPVKLCGDASDVINQLPVVREHKRLVVVLPDGEVVDFPEAEDGVYILVDRRGAELIKMSGRSTQDILYIREALRVARGDGLRAIEELGVI